MMTYLALMQTSEFKAACVGGGLSDLHMMMQTRPDMEEVYMDLIPDYEKQKKRSLDARSAIQNVEKITRGTPILMLHGTADWRVVPQMALELSSEFIRYRIPHRLVMFEGGNHGLTAFNHEVDNYIRDWFRRYLKEGEELPDLEPHGR
jgi:dipeptidyl aminopeptidase/acylaminoacyl peptidase